MNKKCILFDADGVVIQSEMFGVHYQKENSISPDEMLPFYKGVFQDCLIGKADLKEVIEPWLAKWNWRGRTDDFLKNWFNFENKPDKKILDLIKNLRDQGILCYLATNQEIHRTNYMRNEMGFEKIFDGIFSSAEIGFKKPDQNFYKIILQKLKHLDTKEILYVDDTISHVNAAKSIGLEIYWYKNFNEFVQYISQE